MIYKTPGNVVSPKDTISSVQVLLDDGPDSVSIARIVWNGVEVIGMRWNIAMREWNEQEKINNAKECLGMPVSRGYPTWFILPEEMFDPNSKISKVLNDIK